MSDLQPLNHDGFVDEKMSRIFGRSWRTSVAGFATAACSLVVVADLFVPHPVLHAMAGVCTALGLAGAGVVGLKAKDKGVSGTSR